MALADTRKVLAWASSIWSSALAASDLDKAFLVFVIFDRLFLTPEQDLDWGPAVEALPNRIRSLLLRTKLDVQVGRGYSDQKYLSDFQEAIQQNNFRGMLSFFRTVERGIGFGGELVSFVRILGRILARTDMSGLAKDISQYVPLVSRLVIGSLKLESVLTLSELYSEPSQFPLLICIEKVFANVGSADSEQSGLDRGHVARCAGLLARISTRGDETRVTSFVLDCLSLSLNKNTNASFVAHAVQSRRCIADYIGRIDFFQDDSGEIAYSTALEFGDEELIDDLSIKIYHAFFKSLGELEYKRHPFTFTSYYPFILHAAHVLSGGNHGSFLHLVEARSLELLRALSSWFPEQIPVESSRWCYWVMSSKKFDNGVVDRSALPWSYRIMEDPKIMRALASKIGDELVDFEWTRTVLEAPDDVNQIRLPIRDQVITITWTKGTK